MDRSAFLSQAQTLLEQGDYEGALDLMRPLLDRNPGDIDALIVQCHACMRSGRLEDAISVIEDVEKAILGLSRLYSSMGDICFTGGLNQEAARFYRRFMALNPDPALSRGVLGKLRTLEEDQREFISPLEGEDAVADPVSSGFQTLTMVDLYVRQGHFAAAEALLVQMQAEDRDNAAVRDKLADVRAALQRKEMSRRKRELVVEKLSNWLDILQRRSLHAV